MLTICIWRCSNTITELYTVAAVVHPLWRWSDSSTCSVWMQGPINGICTRSIQGVVTYMSLVEMFVTAIKFFESVLGGLIIPFRGSWFVWFPRVKGQIAATHSWLLQFRGQLDPLIGPPKGLDSILILVTNTVTCNWLPLVNTWLIKWLVNL